MTFERLNADGIWTKETEEEARTRILAECIDRYGDEKGREAFKERWSALTTPVTPESELTEGEKYLMDKMQSEQEVHEAWKRSGRTLDLSGDPLAPGNDDDESIPLDDLVPQEYDDAGAIADLDAREAQEAA